MISMFSFDKQVISSPSRDVARSYALFKLTSRFVILIIYLDPNLLLSKILK